MSKTLAFNSVKIKKPNTNYFEFNPERLTSCNMGKLVPVFSQEVLPGDSWKISVEHLLRTMPLVSPMMHRVKFFCHFWFVPNRIQWDGWEDFITEDPNVEPPVHPYFNMREYAPFLVGSLPDHLEYPTGVVPASDDRVNPFPLSAYARIWNEFYRDENLQAEVDVDLIDGDNTNLLYQAGLFERPFNRAWKQDYFTSCLPFAQKGSPVTIPLGTSADIIFNDATAPTTLRNNAGGNVSAGQLNAQSPDQSAPRLMDDAGNFLALDNSDSLLADLSTATAAQINDLRTAFKVQEWLELNARAGTRYSEQLRAHFGVISDDARLQRPEYIGGSSSPVVIGEVLQTSQTDTTPLGEMGGRGISSGMGMTDPYYAKEHGWIIGVVSIMPEALYMQGLPRKLSRLDKFDYYFPMFAHLGEQAVKNKEIFYSGNVVTNEETFGYQSRYAELRDISNSVHGQFKTSLDYWHMGRIFSSVPPLDGQFVSCEPSYRVFADTDADADHILMMLHFNCSVRRPLPLYGVPSF